MRDDIRPADVTVAVAPVTASAFVAEVAAFRVAAADPGVSLPAKARAWDAIVRHAALLESQEPGFERAGVALKEALCLWLDVRASASHP
jgi:hypothetical protein